MLALAGGSTPRPAYEALAADARVTPRDWARIHLAFGDERVVPPDDPASNYHMVREALLDRVPIPAANVHRIRGEEAAPVAAKAYERELHDLLAPDGRFDLVLLGLGADGHTASLFPMQPAVHERSRWVLPVSGIAGRTDRVTLTPVVLNAARAVLFLVTGEAKSETLRAVLEGAPDPDRLPAQVVRPEAGQVSWLVDEGAVGSFR